MKLLYIDGNGTSNMDLQEAVYLIAGRKVRVPASLNRTQAKAFIAERFSMNANQLDRLEQAQEQLRNLDTNSIEQLSGESTRAEIVNAIKSVASAVEELRDVLRFQMLEDPPVGPV